MLSKKLKILKQNNQLFSISNQNSSKKEAQDIIEYQKKSSRVVTNVSDTDSLINQQTLYKSDKSARKSG